MAEPAQTESDEAVRRALLDGLRQVPNSAYRIEQTWVEAAGTWVFAVEPNNARAVSIWAGAEDGSVNLTVGNSWFEICAIEDVPAIVEAASLGRIEEIGNKGQSQARVDSTGRQFHFGHVQLPLAWMWRRKRRFEPYVESVDLRDRHPDWQPPNGWSVSRPRDPNGWVASWVDCINHDGASHYDSNAETLIIERLGEESFPEPWRIAVSEADLAAFLASFLDSDGTVYGINDPDEPVDTDGMMAVFSLFLIHVDEDAFSGDGLTEFQWRLDPKRGLRLV